MIRPFFELFNFSRSKPLLAAALMAALISPNQALADLSDWKYSGIMDIPSGLRTRGGQLLQQLRIIFEHLAGKCLRFANFII